MKKRLLKNTVVVYLIIVHLILANLVVGSLRGGDLNDAQNSRSSVNTKQQRFV
jgi:hypothetical protein